MTPTSEYTLAIPIVTQLRIGKQSSRHTASLYLYSIAYQGSKHHIVGYIYAVSNASPLS
jgi:hypothetical protein